MTTNTISASTRTLNDATLSTELARVLSELDATILGNSLATRMALVCLLAQGHLLIEDIPGVGKTTLSHTLANLLGLPFKRVQFTSDLLPTDVLGVTIYDPETKRFTFKRGPIFTSVLLADEINRATPKTQSALLQAMEEYEVSIEGRTLPLDKPFFVIATQNPLEQHGTFALPESQLDRFLIRLSLGYPGEAFEKQLLQESAKRAHTEAVLSPAQLLVHMEKVNSVHCAPPIIDYLWQILEATRRSEQFQTGLSPRAGLQWLRAARAYAYLDGRDSVLPDDIRLLAPYVAAHRLHTNNGKNAKLQLATLMQGIPAL